MLTKQKNNVSIKGYFDELEFWDSSHFDTPIIKEDQIIIPTDNILVYPEYPLNNTDKPIMLSEARLIFKGVQKSEIIVYEYLDDPKSDAGFKDPYPIIDDSFIKTDEEVETYIIEGVLKEPLSWVTWTIISHSFELEVSVSTAKEYNYYDA